MNNSPYDWAGIEVEFRAGRSFRAIAKQFGLSSSRVKQRSDKENWQRDLAGPIQERAAQLAAERLALQHRPPPGPPEPKPPKPSNERTIPLKPMYELAPPRPKMTDEEIIEVNAERVACVRGEHRVDITRARALVVKLMTACEAEAVLDDELQAMFAAMKAGIAGATQAQIDEMSKRVASLPTRIKCVRDLAETLRVLVIMEREAYGIAALMPPADAPKSVDPMEGARRLAFALARAADHEDKQRAVGQVH